MPTMPRALHTHPIPTVKKAAVNTADLSVSAVLTWPLKDHAGDIVDPAGLDFARHQADPWVDLEHTGERCGWARKSLAAAGGSYAVRYQDVDLDGGTFSLPIGTTYFDPKDKLSSQVFALVERDALPGVSLEFVPWRGFYKSLGRSPLEDRDAYEFRRVSVLRWTHCARPVNAGALTIAKGQTAPDPLLSILSANRVGSEQLHPVILKALKHHLPEKRTTVRVEKKAMHDWNDGGAEPTVYDDAAADAGLTEDADGAPEAPATNGVTALYDAAQTILDACEALDAAHANSDSPELIKASRALCDQAKKVAEKFKAAADRHDAKLQSFRDGKDEEVEEFDVEAEAGPEVSTETDDDGVFKGVRGPYRKALKEARARRLTAADLAPDTVRVKKADLQAMKAEFRKLVDRLNGKN